MILKSGPNTIYSYCQGYQCKVVYQHLFIFICMCMCVCVCVCFVCEAVCPDILFCKNVRCADNATVRCDRCHLVNRDGYPVVLNANKTMCRGKIGVPNNYCATILFLFSQCNAVLHPPPSPHTHTHKHSPYLIYCYMCFLPPLTLCNDFVRGSKIPLYSGYIHSFLKFPNLKNNCSFSVVSPFKGQ